MLIRGYTLVEAIFVMVIVSLCLLFSVYSFPSYKSLNNTAKLIGSEVINQQIYSLLKNEETNIEITESSINGVELPVEISGDDISINGKGNVNRAQTIILDNYQQQQEIKVWLGNGRIVFNAVESQFND